jgi:hypothetical protein
MRGPSIFLDDKVVAHKYLDEKKSLETIRKELGLKTYFAVSKSLRKQGIKRRPASYSGDRGATWKGGRTNSAGYIYKYTTDLNHPGIKRCSNVGGYVLEHRLVMESHLGRYLQKWETVHHINGVKDDNRIENLQLLPTGEHNKKCQEVFLENESLKKSLVMLWALLVAKSRGAV